MTLCVSNVMVKWTTWFSHPDPYLEMQNKFDQYSTSYRDIFLFGDFNLRTGSASDNVKWDPFIWDVQDCHDLHYENFDILSLFDSYNVPLDRHNVDSVTNVYGSQLEDFCKYNNIFLLNGRLGTDHITSKLTCKDCSTVDYSFNFCGKFWNDQFFRNTRF